MKSSFILYWLTYHSVYYSVKRISSFVIFLNFYADSSADFEGNVFGQDLYIVNNGNDKTVVKIAKKKTYSFI